jgi:hypothetical protein
VVVWVCDFPFLFIYLFIQKKTINSLVVGLCSSKDVIKQAQLHLTIQKARKDSIIRQSRADIAQLLQNGQLDQALARVTLIYVSYIFSQLTILILSIFRLNVVLCIYSFFWVSIDLISIFFFSPL